MTLIISKDLFPLLMNVYALRNTLTMLPYIYSRLNHIHLLPAHQRGYIEPDLLMKESFGQMPALYEMIKLDDGQMRKQLNTTNLDTFSVIKKWHSDLNPDKFLTIYNIALSNINFTSIGQINNPEIENFLNNQETLKQLYNEMQILHGISQYLADLDYL